MAEQPSSDEIFRRLEQLKANIEALRSEGEKYRMIASVLAAPLNGHLGSHKAGYDQKYADPNVTDTKTLSERILSIHGEHFDLHMNQARHLTGLQREAFMKELEDLRRQQ